MQISEDFTKGGTSGAMGYSWETEYERTWEALKEDESGRLKCSVENIISERALAKRQILLLQRLPRNIRLGMKRSLVVIIDHSRWMEQQDFRPTRLICTIKVLSDFIPDFFKQNPVSQMCVLATKDGKTVRITPMTSHPKKHIQGVQTLDNASGEMSLQNSIQLAIKLLLNIPSHISKEILLISGSLTTCDPGNIHDIIPSAVNNSIRFSAIGLAGDVYIVRCITEATGGNYDIAIDETHLKIQLGFHTNPPPAKVTQESALIRTGFPTFSVETTAFQCLCHMSERTLATNSNHSAYTCPQCYSKYCEVPIQCKACSLNLVSAPHLARSYQHLFPVLAYKEVESNVEANGEQFKVSFDLEYKDCSGCGCNLTYDMKRFICQICNKVFCIDCDVFIHETLHSCPKCALDYI